MSLLSRGTRAAARPLRQTVQRQTQRNASSGHGHDHAHGHGESALHLPSANPGGNEGLGVGVYMTIASIPLFYVAYSLSKSDPDNSINKLYERYKESQAEVARRDLIHVAAMQHAISDRAQLVSYPRETSGPDLKYPEFFNAGSPWNVVAGEGSADMKKLEEYLNQKQVEADQERRTRAAEAKGKLNTVYETPAPDVSEILGKSGGKGKS